MPSDPKIRDSQYRVSAMRQYGSDEIEIDDCAATGETLVARVDADADDGAWVKAWIWVRNEDAAKVDG